LLSLKDFSKFALGNSTKRKHTKRFQKKYQMETKNYSQIANMIRLGPREIARRVGTSHVTVQRVLEGKGQPFYSKDTEKKVHDVIDKEVESMRQALNRLSAGAVGAN